MRWLHLLPGMFRVKFCRAQQKSPSIKNREIRGFFYARARPLTLVSAHQLRSVTQGPRNFFSRLPHEGFPIGLVAVGRCRDRQAGSDLPFVVEDLRGNATQADLGFFDVVGDTRLANLVEIGFKGFEAGERIFGFSRKAGPLGVSTDFRRAVRRQEQFAQGGQVQGRASANKIDDANQRTAAGSAFDINDIVLVANAEVDGFADAIVQFLHERTGNGTNADARFDDVAEFEQANSQGVGAVVVAFDKPRMGHDGQDAVCCRGVQAGCLRERLEGGCVVRGGQNVEQRHHAFDDLN